MCGRTACTLAPDEIIKACRYRDRTGQKKVPGWRDTPGGQQYYTSYNVAPGAHTPVLISSQHAREMKGSDRILQPMQWGLVPSWHKGNPKGVMYNMNNARSDSLLNKRTFKVPLEKSQRCVVLADGYYEWKTSKDNKKQPFYLYFPQIKSQNDTDTSEKPDRRLLTMAGVFDIWTPSQGEEPLYSYSIITTEADPSVSHIHHRMPAILTNDDEVNEWLDVGNVPLKKAFELIKPKQCLELHPVSKVVNNSRNNTPECVKVIDLQEEKKSASSMMMMQWLGKSNKKPTNNVKNNEGPEQESGEPSTQVKREAGEVLMNPVAKRHKSM